MIANGTNQTQDRLALPSRISDIARIPAWIEGLAARYNIPANVQFAIDLCLEEAISNVVRHGYAGADDHPAIVGFTRTGEGCFQCVIEDEAPRFNPLQVPQEDALNLSADAPVGGQGMRLLRHFADDIEYEATPTGNRLTLSFQNPIPPPRD